MRRQVALAGLGLALLAGSGTAYADTAGGVNGPIAYTAPGTNDPDAPDEMWAIEPDGSQGRELLAGHAELNAFPVWSPDGLRLAFYRGHALVVARADGSEEHEVRRGVAGASVTWSPDGTRLAYSGGDDFDKGAALWVVNVDGTDAHEVYGADDLGDPAWSPRGDVIAFEADDPTQPGDNLVLYTVNADGTDLQQLTDFDPHGPNSFVHSDASPAWSPDGTRIAFTSDRDRECLIGACEQFDLYVVSADGTGPVTRLAEPGIEYNPSWSPDGTSLAYVWYSGMVPDVQPDTGLEIRDLASGAVRRLTSSARYSASWSAQPGSRPTADLAATLSANAGSVLPGTAGTLTATVQNSGPATAESAAIEVRAAPGSTLDATGSPGCLAAAGGALRCAVGSLPPGAQAHVSVGMTAGPAAVGEASAMAISATSDPDPTNNRAVVAVAVCSQLGTAGADRLRGTAGPDVLCGRGGDDTLMGSGGDDVLLGGAGHDRLLGGGGKDTASYAQSRKRVRVDLGRGRAEGDGADRLRRIEDAVGSPYADRLTGSPRGNVLVGGAGADWLAPEAGPDRLVGGLGRDRVDYRDAARAVHVDLDKRDASGEGDDRWVSIEGAFGTRFADRITGSLIADWVAGEGGADRIEAQGGNDRIEGGSGADVLQGGDGNDGISGGGGVDRCRQDFGRGRPTHCERG